jgi:hypothetical protein
LLGIQGGAAFSLISAQFWLAPLQFLRYLSPVRHHRAPRHPMNQALKVIPVIRKHAITGAIVQWTVIFARAAAVLKIRVRPALSRPQ